MKRSLFFVSALLAGMAVSAQEYGLVDYMSIDGGTGYATPLLAGTVVATGINGLEVGVACDDSYNTVNTSTDDYEAYVFNGTYLNGMTGIMGSANPKGANGRHTLRITIMQFLLTVPLILSQFRAMTRTNW